MTKRIQQTEQHLTPIVFSTFLKVIELAMSSDSDAYWPVRTEAVIEAHKGPNRGRAQLRKILEETLPALGWIKQHGQREGHLVMTDNGRKIRGMILDYIEVINRCV